MDNQMQSSASFTGQLAYPGHQNQSTTDLIFDPNAMVQMHKIAECMASGVSTVPRHLQGNPSDCLAVVMQAAQWRMNPYSVAQKTHLVSGNLGYEAQLVNAVVSSSTKIQGSFGYEWYGPWERVIGKFTTKTSSKGNTYQAPAWSPKDEEGCGIKVSATLRGESSPRTLDLLLSQAQVRNSTLWASDPKQQLAYLAVKRWARLYAPDVILGVYTPDEMDDTKPQQERSVNEAPKSSSAVDNIVSDAKKLTEPAQVLMGEVKAAATLNTLKGVYEKIKKAAQDGDLNDFDRSELKREFDKAHGELQAIAEAEMQHEEGAE